MTAAAGAAVSDLAKHGSRANHSQGLKSSHFAFASCVFLPSCGVFDDFVSVVAA